MFSIFQSHTHKELSKILNRMQMNAENNYRDATLSDLHELESRFHELDSEGKLNNKQKAHYSALIEHYKMEFRGFTHKEQRAGW